MSPVQMIRSFGRQHESVAVGVPAAQEQQLNVVADPTLRSIRFA